MLKFEKTVKAIFAAPLVLFAMGFFSCAGVPVQDGAQGQDDSQEQDAAAQLGSQEFFLPERFEEIAAGRGDATFKTSKPKCALYINGEYHGLTPLKAAGLVPGRYAVQIKRKGFKTVNIAIQVKDGVSDFYYIEMEEDSRVERGNDSPREREPTIFDESAPENLELSQDKEAAPAAGTFGEESIPVQTQSQEKPEL